MVHVRVDRNISGSIAMSEPGTRFDVGDAIAVRVSRYITKEGERHRMVSGEQTDEAPSTALRRTFAAEVRAEKDMGFTQDGIFIPPPLMREQNIVDGALVSGIALLSLNKKHNTWAGKLQKSTRSK